VVVSVKLPCLDAKSLTKLVTWLSAICIGVLLAAVINPFPLTVNVLLFVAFPKLPTLLFTVANVKGIDAFALPLNEALVPVPSPVNENVLPVCKVVAVPALPVIVVWSPVLLPLKFDAVNVPKNNPLPLTCNFCDGVTTPNPTLPLLSTPIAGTERLLFT